MEFLQYFSNPQFIRWVMRHVNTPFVLMDIGCSGGVEPAWHVFGDALQAYGVDPDEKEIKRLRKNAPKGVVYEAGFMTVEKKYQAMLQAKGGNTFARTSTMHAIVPSATTNTKLSEQFYTYTQLCALQRIEDVDFIKIDIDSCDFQLLYAIAEEGFLNKQQVLGVGVEVTFEGNDNPHQNTFHNVDRLLKKHAFQIYALSTRHYSLAALPATFSSDICAQTASGRVFQGDAIYFRDLIEQPKAFTQAANDKLGKLLCLLCLVNQADSAAELLTKHPERFGFLGDLEKGLNLLVPTNHLTSNKKYTYRQYVSLFKKNPKAFVQPHFVAPIEPTLKNIAVEYLRIHPLGRFVSKHPALKRIARKMLAWISVYHR